jgi:hypothetical protein
MHMLFAFVERRTNNNRSLCVGFLHGSAGVAERLLGEALRVPARFSTLRPCVVTATED